MSKEMEYKMVPKLRFPEFREAGEWFYKNGDKIFDQISNKNHNSDLPILAITQEFGAIPRNEIDYSVIVSDKSVESYRSNTSNKSNNTNNTNNSNKTNNTNNTSNTYTYKN